MRFHRSSLIKILNFLLKRIISKISNDRRDYESVDDKSLSKASYKNEKKKKEFGR